MIKKILLSSLILSLFIFIPASNSRTKLEKIKEGTYIVTSDNIRTKRESIDFRGHEYIEVTKFHLEYNGLGVSIVHDQACNHPKHRNEIL